MVPQCIGIIMDGNRRWARARGMSSFEGHRAGKEKLKEVMEWVKEAGIPHLVVYAFSSENWNRTKEEVGYLMDLLRLVFSKELPEFIKKEVRIRFVGERSRLPWDVEEVLRTAEKETEEFSAHTLWIALSYGGRDEIVHATNSILDLKSDKPVTEEVFSRYLFTAGMPDPDLIIRTGGERRLSNFLPWQSVYSELFFEDTYWPDFEKEDFTRILKEFAGRERRRGA
ncbi:MAG: polyprenyl diphosphate synthase [Patescibacteria group bacterium]